MIILTKKIILLFSVFFILACNTGKLINTTTELKKKHDCCKDSLSDQIYEKKNILNEFVTLLNELLPDFKNLQSKGFFLDEDCQLSFCNLEDLVDTLNTRLKYYDCIKFKEGHIYHFSPMDEQYSFSNIAVLKDGKVRIFKKVNCPENGGDKIDDVIYYIRSFLPVCQETEEIIKRVRNYRNYGFYFYSEFSEFKCR